MITFNIMFLNEFLHINEEGRWSQTGAYLSGIIEEKGVKLFLQIKDIIFAQTAVD